MTVTGAQLDAFGQLARALGIIGPSGDANPSWFGDPVGSAGGNAHGLRDVLGDDGQREALLGFVDEVLGPPDRATVGDAVWVPLFRESSPQVTIFAVVEPVAGAVRLGVGLEHATTGAAPTVATRLHVPLFQLARGTGPAPAASGGLPGWLLIGRPGGRIDLTVDVTLRDGAPPAGAASLGGLGVTLAVPTAAGDALGVALRLRDLQLPGAAAPRSFALDAASLDAAGLAALGHDAFELIIGLVRAQADALDLTQPALRPFAALTGVLGLRDVPGLPPLPLADLTTRGIAAVVAWIETVLGAGPARAAWLGQLALVLPAGATVDAARGAVTATIGAVTMAVGVRIGPGTGGHPVLTPWMELSLAGQTGARVRLTADVLRADTGTDAVTALPALVAEAVFGADAGGGALLAGSPAVGSLHVGLALTDARRPTFVLTLHDVTVAGRAYPLLDLSSPAAAVDAAGAVLDGALASALAALGPAGAFAARLLGLDPPPGIAALSATAVIADPLGAVRAYWQALLATPGAMANVLGAIRPLVVGGAAVPVPGAGTAADPWRVDLVGPLGLRAWTDGAQLVVDAAVTVTTPVFDEFAVDAMLGVTLARIGFSPPRAVFVDVVQSSLRLHRVDGAVAQLALGGSVGAELRSVGVAARWTPTGGFQADVEADGLAITVRDRFGVRRIAVPLPARDATGQLVFAAPAWDAVEAAVAVLAGQLHAPPVDLALTVLGWNGTGPRLRLAALFGADPTLAIEGWFAALLLDCQRLRTALGPVAALLSGFRLHAPLGTGSERTPFRCPVASNPRAPGLTAWLDPGCPPFTNEIDSPFSAFGGELVPEPAELVAQLGRAAASLPELADLLIGRDGLAGGLGQLVERWAGTDGLVAAPATLPDGVTAIELPGYSYDELVALGSTGMLLGDVVDPAPGAVVHVGCEETWAEGRAAGTAFDASGPNASGTAAPGTVPPTGDGMWFVRLPTPDVARAARPDRGGVGEQAARLAAILARRTDPVLVVAYGACGAAAVRAAQTVAAVSDVATVGTPWAGLAVDSLRSGASGDALRFLGRMLRANAEPWSESLVALEATPLRAMRGIVERALAVLAADAGATADTAAFDAAPLPSAGTETRRAGLTVRAVFGAIDADAIKRGIGAVCADGVAARLEAAVVAAGPELPHTGLHVGVDLPVFDLTLGGVLIGAGATLELAMVARAAGGGVTAGALPELAIDLHFGVQDGWMVGGPGATQADVDVRWMSARVMIPFDGRPASAELVLHEARAFSVARERWVVRAGGDGVSATNALPEVRVMMSGVIARLRAASPEFGTLLEVVGLVRDGGLNPAALDRLLFDPGALAASVLGAAPALAAALRALMPGVTGSGATLAWTTEGATVSVDLAARTFGAGVTVAVDGLPTVTASVALSPEGASADLAVGAVDGEAGGLRVVGHAGGATGLRIEWQAPGAATPRQVVLLPTPDVASLRALATVVLPAALAQTVATWARETASDAARPLVDEALDLLGTLASADAQGARRMLLPIGLFDDPGAWLAHGTARWRTDPVGSAVGLLDALAPLVAPGGGGAAGWPVAPGVTVRYAAESGRLRLTLDVELAAALGATTVRTHVVAGLLVGPAGAPPGLVFEAGVTVDGRGLLVRVAPSVQVDLVRPAPAVSLTLYPSGPGLASTLGAVGDLVLPPVLNAVAAHRTDAGAALVKLVGQAVFDLGGALDLLDGAQFTGARVTAFAGDPAGRLLARIPQLAATGTAALARALDPAQTVVHVTGPTAGRLTLGFGAMQALRLTLDGAGATPAVTLAADFAVPGVGHVVVDALRLSADGLQLAARVGPAALDLGALVLRPLLVVRAGVAGTGFDRMLGIGLALDPLAASSVEFRWTLDARPPTLVAITRDTTGEHVDADAFHVATQLLALAASLAGGVMIEQLRPVLTPRVTGMLQGVVFTDAPASTALDPALFLALLDAPQLLARLQRLLWNAATATTPLALTIGGVVTVGLVGRDSTPGHKQLGLNLSLPAGRRFALASGDPTVELEVDASWVDPVVAPGLTIFVVDGAPASGFRFDQPGVQIAGIGLRFSKTSGPLLDLGPVSVDAIAVHVYGEATSSGVGGGVQLELAGFAIAPSGAGGSNAVANGILGDAGSTGSANRPSFSPALAVQHHPGESGVHVSLRAGPPPGPWWVVVQRQLGPLYVEQIGLDTAEQNGRLSRISLLFDGRVSLFGLTASVDQLSLSWLGGDVFRASSWAADLQGLAVSADMAGVSLAGGLLKSTVDGNVGYLGMLLGRFGVYGLTVFGGYTNQNGSPSFFVFGALNGPIGGPPAFFLTGIGGGLGINRGLRVPDDLSRFNEYPFIQALDPAARVSEPMEKLRELALYFPPQVGTFWFAAGISFTCFALVDGIAVVAVSFGNGLEIDLFGLARMALPRPGAALVSIELGLLARFSTSEGLFSIRAQLTENSWLLYEDVRLTGGFAFVIWWKGANKGQFVLTIGGYHPSFHRDGYPEVPRVGLSWRVTDDISVKGGAYFALTSEALMAGVDVEVSADFGFAWARIAFGANGIVYFDPFWLEVEAYSRISAGIKIHTFFGTIRFSVSTGASVRVCGPEFSGEASIDVGPASVSVSFGSQRQVAARVLAWGEFTAKYLEDAGGAARVLSAITGRGTLPSATAGRVAAPTADGSADKPFEVFAEFEITITTSAPAQRFDLGLVSGPVAVAVTRSDGAPGVLGLKPMKAGGLSSTVRLTLEKLTGGAAVAVPAQLQLLGAHLTTTTDAFPIGAWGAPDPDGLPAPPLPKGDVLFAGNSVRLEAVATQLDRGPSINYYTVEASRRPLPLQAGGSARGDLLTLAGAVAIPAAATAEQALEVARARLFAPDVRPVPEGVLARGTYSNLSRASFGGDRAAPPLFGTLADGLAVRNGKDGLAAKQAPPTGPVWAGARAPRVTALLAAGAGVAPRAPVTTVADRALKRRVAPSLTSVQTRLAQHLPVRLVTTARPAADAKGTVIATQVAPRTDAPGATRAYVSGQLGGLRGLDAVVGGLARGKVQRRTQRDVAGAAAGASSTDGQPLAPGDLVVLTLPDASVDPADARRARPTLGITGDRARVTMVRGDGLVLVDAALAGDVVVPAGTALIAVQAGGSLEVTDGLAGWHEQTRIAALGVHNALGAGCVLAIEAPRLTQQVGWIAAADAVRDAATVTTRFDRSVHTVVLVLAEADPTRLDGVALDLLGATRAVGPTGALLPPTVVLAGTRAALVYAVDPGDDGPVSVRVAAGGDWRIVGVLAGDTPVDAVARVIAERGIAAVAGRLLAATGVTGAGCSVRWNPVETDPATPVVVSPNASRRTRGRRHVGR